MRVSKKEPEENFWDRVDFWLEFSQEKKLDNGEDANIYSVEKLNGSGNVNGFFSNKQEVLLGVFDGCGGSGARKYSTVSNKTGAYLASRITSGIIRDWFYDSKRDLSTEELGDLIQSKLHECFNSSGMGSEQPQGIINKLAKILPTTAAFAVCKENHGTILADCYWAGDSRLYLLDEDGLAQISVDDLNIKDAMEALYIGGKMTNVVHLPKDGEDGFLIHHSQLYLKKPGILFAATDGCFDYITSPMEFEYLLLETLQQSQSVNEWERCLKDEIGRIAQDDSSMTAIAFDYGSYFKLKDSLAYRTQYLHDYYISGLKNKGKEEKTQLWYQYRSGYYRL